MKILDTPNLKFLKVGVDTDPLNNHNLEYLEKQNAIAALILNHSGDKVLFVNQYRAVFIIISMKFLLDLLKMMKNLLLHLKEKLEKKQDIKEKIMIFYMIVIQAS